ncbi:metal-dependent hydrolase [Roseovarius sp.]|uniref:metal-dependent hydrolase n=1 Tax=Roseovarius sp. TaxID=1486281 RepID=UPI003565DB6D
MTTPEHTLVGILGGFSIGLHTRFGWTAIAFAAIISNVPDLDGLPILIDMQGFEVGHRVWGHNLLAIAVSTLLIAAFQYRFHWIERCAEKLKPVLPKDSQELERTGATRPGFLSLCLIGVAFQCVHLICDMTVSGGHGLSDWLVRPFWPFEDSGFVFPLIPWGDVGPTVIMMLAVIGIAKFGNASRIAIFALTLLCIYMLCRGYARRAW